MMVGEGMEEVAAGIESWIAGVLEPATTGTRTRVGLTHFRTSWPG